jgi:hypothetical protein
MRLRSHAKYQRPTPTAGRPFTHKPMVDRELGPAYNKDEQCLAMVGNAGQGKLEWAKRQFKEPHVVRCIADLYNMPPYTTGLIFLYCEFAESSEHMQYNLLDLEFMTTPRIFITDKMSNLFDMGSHRVPLATNVHVWYWH